ncbi:MAG: hypothetical protein ABIA93_02760 [Candidatus Woesearchaeota archaeon]
MKAQVQQVFIYALTAIIVGLVLLLGYTFISKTLNQGCDVQLVKFKEGMQRELSKGTNFGSFTQVHLGRPCDYSNVCFVDNGKIGNQTFLFADNSVIESSVLSGVPTTIFIYKQDATEPLIDSALVTVADSSSIICIPSVAGKFSFGLEGKGKTVQVVELQ